MAHIRARREAQPEVETWATVEREARNDPILHRMVRRTMGPLGVFREQALIETVLCLTRERRAMIAAEVERISNEPHK